MNRYEAWLASQPPPQPRSFEQLVLPVYDTCSWISVSTHVPMYSRRFSTNVVMFGLEWVETITPTMTRSEYRISQEQSRNHSPFRAYLGYGQGLRRRA